MRDIERDLRDLENAATLLEETTEEFVNQPTALCCEEAADDVRRIATAYRGAVEALTRYGQHESGCALAAYPDDLASRCTCGLAGALAAAGGQ